MKLLSRVDSLKPHGAHQDPPSMGSSRQEYWSELPFPSPGDLPYPGVEPRSPALLADVLLSEPLGSPIIGHWNVKVGSQEPPGVTGKFGLGVQNEAGQRLIEFCQENALVIANTLFQQHIEGSTHGKHQMINTKIRKIIFFAAEDGEALSSQQKKDWKLIMNS